MSAVFSFEPIMKEGIKIKRSISKTPNFNPFTLRPSYDELSCRRILWCYHSNKPLWQNFSIVLVLWILQKGFPIFVNYLIWPLLELFMKLKWMLLKMPNHKTESKINLPHPLTTHFTRLVGCLYQSYCKWSHLLVSFVANTLIVSNVKNIWYDFCLFVFWNCCHLCQFL